jgi:hypothetical protein
MRCRPKGTGNNFDRCAILGFKVLAAGAYSLTNTNIDLDGDQVFTRLGQPGPSLPQPVLINTAVGCPFCS